MGGQKKPLGGGYSQGANAFFNAFFNHTYCIEPTLTNSKLFHQFRAALFIFRSPLYIVNAILVKKLLYQQSHFVFTTALAFHNAFCNAFFNASAFHFIKHITHIAWASFPVIGAGIICVFKSVVIRHDAQQLKRFLHMRQIL
jgi:hypothetical protein